MWNETLIELAGMLIRLSLLSFGSVNAVLGEMEREMVAHGWLTHQQFMEGYSLSQITPGPGMTLMTIPLGYQVAGLPGALVGWLAFFLPTATATILASTFWWRVRDSRWPQAFRVAITPVALGLILAGAYSLTLGTVHDLGSGLLVGAVLWVLLRTRVAVPLVMLAAGAIGVVALQP